MHCLSYPSLDQVRNDRFRYFRVMLIIIIITGLGLLGYKCFLSPPKSTNMITDRIFEIHDTQRKLQQANKDHQHAMDSKIVLSPHIVGNSVVHLKATNNDHEWMRDTETNRAHQAQQISTAEIESKYHGKNFKARAHHQKLAMESIGNDQAVIEHMNANHNIHNQDNNYKIVQEGHGVLQAQEKTIFKELQSIKPKFDGVNYYESNPVKFDKSCNITIT